MLGRNISVFKQKDGSASPALLHAPRGAVLARWQAGVLGLAWIDELVEQDLAVRLDGGDCSRPFKEYTAKLGPVRAQVLEGPPYAHETWLFSQGAIVMPNDKTTIDEDALRAGDADEWVLIWAQDED